MVIVPGWLGVQLVGWFFEAVRPRAEAWRLDGTDLHHAAGLVLCHHDAPIHRITALAKELADVAKADRTVSRISYEVLESFDFLGGRVNDVRRHRYPAMPPDAWVLEPCVLQRLATGLGKLREIGLTRRQLRRLAIAAALDEDGNAFSMAKKTVAAEVADGMGRLDIVLGSIEPSEERRRWLWLHLELLHDYLPMEP